MEIFGAFVVVLALILFVLLSINKKLSIIAGRFYEQQNKPFEDEHIFDVKDTLSEIKILLEEIKYTTDLVEKYKIPTPDERKSIDQMRIDFEIDEMLSRRK